MTDQHERIRAAFRLNLEQQKKRAKELLKAAKAGDALAHARGARIKADLAENSSAADLKLSDAQFVIARELGFSSWPELKAHAASMDRARNAIDRKTHAPDDAKTLHLRCGSDIKSTLLEGGFQGDFLEHSYPYCHGPVTDTADHFEREAKYIVAMAGRFMNLPFEEVLTRRREEERKLAESAERYERIVLWMEHDCFDQLVLVRCLAHYARASKPSVLEMIDINHFPGAIRFIGLGQLPVEAIRLLWDRRQTVTQEALQLASEAWAALLSSDPKSLAALMRSGCPALPNLASALHRLLQELPSTENGMSFTERLTLQLLSEQSATINELFTALTYKLDPLPFATDLMLMQTIERLQTLSDAILTRTAGANVWQDTLSITDAGRRLLRDELDLMAMKPKTRWVGGVEIRADAPAWRWDEGTREVVLR